MASHRLARPFARLCRRAFAIALSIAMPLAACAAGRASEGDGMPSHPGTGAQMPLEYLPALRGDYFPLHSRATGRTYHVYVRLPEGYAADPGKRWPVVYLLDGDSLFPLLASMHLFLHYDEKLPDAIVVGIAYGGFDPAINKRNIDFSAPGGDTPEGEGGAPAFLAFLERELLPETERRHRIDPDRRVLLGQSRGGYFVLWSALRAPDLFWARIASNPAFTRTRDALFHAPAPHQRDDLRLVIASGARDEAFRMENAMQWQASWKDRPGRPWTLRHEVLAEGTHAASIGEAYRRSMLWLFADAIEGAPPQSSP